MAQVLAKIFQSRKYQNVGQSTRQQSKSNTKWHVTRFTKEDIHLVLFKDCVSSGRKLILDSRRLRRVTLEDLLCEKCLKIRNKSGRRTPLCRSRCPACPGLHASLSSLPKKYKADCSGRKSDVHLVGEMIFGTTPLASSGTTVKVHSLKDPHQLMLSSVFQYKRCKGQVVNDFDELDSFESSMYASGMPKRNSENNLSTLGTQSCNISRPVDMPSLRVDNSFYGSDTSLNLSVTSTGSLQTPLPSPGANSSASINSSSRLSMMRRMRRSFNSSLQYNTTSSHSTGLYCPPSSGNTSAPASGCESPQPALSDCGSVSSAGRRKGTRIGMSVIFSLDEFDDSRREFETFFFSHITLIEGQLVSLRNAIERSACEAKPTEYIMEALEEFRGKVYDLYTARRLANPVWLSMMAATTQRNRISEKFVRELSTLIDRYDTRSTSYFVSTVLTGVLMYHLAWVPTVTPSGEHHSSYSDKHSARWMDMLAKSHPYNPLWAQLSDMYGAIGMPPRLARTVVTGKKMDTIVKFLFVLSYFIRCSEIHETLDDCYDEANLLDQIESAVDELCVQSLEEDAVKDQSDFVMVDAPSTSIFMPDMETDSGLVSQYTGESKLRPTSCDEPTTVGGESGYIEPKKITSLADVERVPASSPSDKVRQWINTSQLNEQSARSSQAAVPPNSLSSLNRTATDSTLENSALNSLSVTPGTTSSKVTCLPPPTESRIDIVSPVGRAPTIPAALPERQTVKPKTGSDNRAPPVCSLSSRANLVRLFSAEYDDMDELFDGKPPSLSRQPSSNTSQFDEYFDDENLESFSMFLPQENEEPANASEPPTPTNNRNMLFKVLKETGFHQHASGSTPQQGDVADQQPCREKHMSSSSTPLSPGSAIDEQFRPRNLSVDKQSSRCSTPQTLMGGGVTTPCSAGRTRKLSAYQTTVLAGEDPDLFNNYEELKMPKSTEVSKLADTSISTTSFGRQQLAGFSDHYLSDFVLHGTSEDDVFAKVQRDLVSSVEHSVLEDRISEAVCVVADTERWCVHVCSSMREQPKLLSASHLVINMVETVSNLVKLKMSSEFILMHMEDRLQEMVFKSRMLSEYIHSRKKVDMDELDAMFGLDVSDIRFLLSVAATHSTLNVHGIY